MFKKRTVEVLSHSARVQLAKDNLQMVIKLAFYSTWGY